MIEVKIEVSQGPGTRILYVIIIIRKGILRNIITSLRDK